MNYIIDLRRDESGWWVASARDVAGCHTQGRSIRQSLSRIREALSVCVDDDISADDLEPFVHLEAEARRAVSRYESARKRLERDQLEARTTAAEAVETLVEGLSLSVRDAGDVLGLSHQRVNQLSKTRTA